MPKTNRKLSRERTARETADLERADPGYLARLVRKLAAARYDGGLTRDLLPERIHSDWLRLAPEQRS